MTLSEQDGLAIDRTTLPRLTEIGTVSLPASNRCGRDSEVG